MSMNAHRLHVPAFLVREEILWAYGICALLMSLFLAPQSYAQDHYIGGEWRCNMKKVSLYTTGNKTIRIEQTANNIVLVGDTGEKSSGRFVGPYELSTPNWEYGNSARLGINVDGTFYPAAEAIAKSFKKSDYADWNFLQWETGMICSTSSAALAAGREAMRSSPQPQRGDPKAGTREDSRAGSTGRQEASGALPQKGIQDKVAGQDLTRQEFSVASAKEPSKARTSTAIPADLSVFLDIRKLTLDHYQVVLGAAMSGMRLVYGDMSKPEEQAFQKHWAPHFKFPSQPMVDYLNKLNPLLVEFLTVRGAIIGASEEFDGAWAEGTIAAGYANMAGAREAFAIASQQRILLDSLNARLEQVTQQIVALGDPPDPESSRKRHREALKVALKAGRIAAKSAPASGSGAPAAGVRLIPSVDKIDGGEFIEFKFEVSPEIAAKATRYELITGGYCSVQENPPTKDLPITVQCPMMFVENNLAPGVHNFTGHVYGANGQELDSGKMALPFRLSRFQNIEVPAPYARLDIGQSYGDVIRREIPRGYSEPSPRSARCRC